MVFSKEAQAYIDSTRASAGGGTPAPASSGSSGSGPSGSGSGADSSGSGGSGGSGNSSGGSSAGNNSGGRHWINVAGGKWSAQQWTLFTTIIVVAVMLAVLILFKILSPEARKIESKYVDHDIAKTAVDLQKAQNVGKRLDLQILKHGGKPTPSTTPSAGCVEPPASAGFFQNAITLTAGMCIARGPKVPQNESDPAGLWVIFKDVPKSIRGEAYIHERAPHQLPDGRMSSVTVDMCITTKKDCVSWLQSKRNVRLVIINDHEGIQINM